MRLPLQKDTQAQRQLLRQLIWSLCVVAPSSLALADEGTTKKSESSPTPALTLPTFPSSVPAPAAVAPTATPALLPALPPATPIAPTAQAAPTLSLPAAPAPKSTLPAPTVVAPTVPAPKVAASADAASAKKDAVIISMPNTLPAPTATSAITNNKTTLPAAPTAAAPMAVVNTSAAAKNSAVPAPGEQVSIKFGAPADKAKPADNGIAQGQRTIPNASAPAEPQAPAAFRLSDKANSDKVPAVPAPPVVTQNTTKAPAPAVDSPVASPKLLTTAAPKALASIPPTSGPQLNDKQSPTAKGVESKLSDTKSVEAKPTTMGSLTVSSEGIAPSTPSKDESRRGAVLIRPKAIVLGQEPTALVQADKQSPVTSETPKAAPSPTTKPSTSPQALASSATGSSSAKMKSVDSKVSPLPPSEHVAAEKVSLKMSDAIKPAEPMTLSNDSAKLPSSTAIVQAAPVSKLPAPQVSTAPLVSTAPQVPAPPQLSSVPLVPPAASAGMPDAVVVAPVPAKAIATDVAQPIVSDAEISTETKLASAKKYSKPADRTIQVGTVALTTMRVDDKDVVKCEVDDTTVCRAIVTADGEVALLPGKVGVTRATLWVKEANGQSKVETADIQVGEVLPIANTDSVELGKLNDSLQRLYPSTSLRVVASDRCIEICGEADSEQQAREVLQLVRKLCLVPVKDKVTVR